MGFKNWIEEIQANLPPLHWGHWTLQCFWLALRTGCTTFPRNEPQLLQIWVENCLSWMLEVDIWQAQFGVFFTRYPRETTWILSGESYGRAWTECCFPTVPTSKQTDVHKRHGKLEDSCPCRKCHWEMWLKTFRCMEQRGKLTFGKTPYCTVAKLPPVCQIWPFKECITLVFNWAWKWICSQYRSWRNSMAVTPPSPADPLHFALTEAF